MVTDDGCHCTLSPVIQCDRQCEGRGGGVGCKDCVIWGGMERWGEGGIQCLQCQGKTEERSNTLKAASNASFDQPWTTRKAKLSATKYYLFHIVLELVVESSTG